MADKEEFIGAIKRFNGSDEAYYRKTWRKWAKAYIHGLGDNVKPAQYGAKLINLLDGEAANVTEHLEVSADLDANDIGKDGGIEKIFTVLDERWPAILVQDREAESMDDLFDCRYQKNEGTSAFVGRAKTIMTKAHTHKATLSDNLKGYLLTRFFGLKKTERLRKLGVD